MKKFLLVALLIPAFSLALAASDDDADTFSARLRGLNEVPPVATAGSGTFSATLSSDGTTLMYKETYANLNAPILFSHIHFGFPREATGIMVFLCGPAAGMPGGPPAGTPNPPPCQGTTSGTVTGSVTAANVIGPNARALRRVLTLPRSCRRCVRVWDSDRQRNRRQCNWTQRPGHYAGC